MAQKTWSTQSTLLKSARQELGKLSKETQELGKARDEVSCEIAELKREAERTDDYVTKRNIRQKLDELHNRWSQLNESYEECCERMTEQAAKVNLLEKDSWDEE